MMKKCFVMTAAAITAALCCPVLQAYAEEAKFANAAELAESWNENSVPEKNEYYSAAGYPDYVCGVWTNTGEADQLVMGLVPGEAGEKGKAEILSLIEDDSSVSFVTQQIPYEKLMDIMNDLTGQMQQVPGFYACGVLDDKNCVIASVELESPSPGLQKIMQYCAEVYGSAVIFEQGSPVEPTTDDEPFVPDYDPNEYDALTGEYWEIGAEQSSEVIYDGAIVPKVGMADDSTPGGPVIADGAVIRENDSKPAPDHNRHEAPVTVKPALNSTEQSSSYSRLLWVLSAVVLLAGAGAVVFGVLRSRSAARRTTAGTVQTDSVSSVKQTEQMIRENAPELPEHLKAQIMEQVQKKTGK